MSAVRTKPRVLCVDDEPHVLESLRDSLRRDFEVVATTNGFHALKVLDEEPCEVVLSDMRMPMINGARFLALARQHAPDTVRVMLTGHSMLPDAAAAVNEGEIFRLLLKPCTNRDLTATLRHAVDHHHEQVRRREMLHTSTAAMIKSLIEVAATSDPDGPARAARIRRQAVELATHASNVEPTWELERACELMQVGAVSFSSQTRSRLALGSRLAREQAVEVERLPELALPFLRGIPALEPVTALLDQATKPFAATRRESAGTPPAAAVLRLVLDYECLERQDAPMETAIRSLESRGGRYSPAILAEFIELLRFG